MQSLPTPSPCDSCSSWGSGGLVRNLTERQRLPPCTDSVAHTTVPKYTGTELAYTCEQMHILVSRSPEGSDLSPWPSRLRSTHSSHPLCCLILLDLAPFPSQLWLLFCLLVSSHLLAFAWAGSSAQKTPLSSFRAQLRMPPLTLWLSWHPFSLLATFPSAITHVCICFIAVPPTPGAGTVPA